MIIYVAMARCSSTPDHNRSQDNSNLAKASSSDTTKPRDTTIRSNVRTDEGDSLLAARIDLSKAKIQVLSVTKKATDDKNDQYYEKCKSWNLQESDLIKIMQDMKTISPTEWHYLYDILRCEMKGKLTLDGEEFKFSLNAGSSLILWNEKGQVYFGCATEKCLKYFLSRPATADDFE